MFCEECGKKGLDDALFCEECGNAFPKSEELDNTCAVIDSEIPVVETPVPEPIIDVAVHASAAPVKAPVVYGKLHIACIALLCVIGACSYALYDLASELCSPEHIAEAYVEAKETNNFPEMLKFFDKDSFDPSYLGVYQQASLKEEVDDVELRVEYMSDDYIDYIYHFEYEHSKETGYGDLSLIKLPSKKWFFFDNWVVNSEYAFIPTTTVQILENVEATLGALYLKDLAVKTQKSTGGTVIYTLPALLRGEYILQVDYPFADSVQHIINVDYYSINNIKAAVSKDTSAILEERAIETLTTIYGNAVQGASFSQISALLNVSSPDYFNQNQYDMKIQNTLSKVDISNYEISDIETTQSIIMFDSTTNDYYVSVSINAEAYVDGDVQATSYFFSTPEPYYDETFGSIRDFTVYYVFNGDDWIISDIKLVYPY